MLHINLKCEDNDYTLSLQGHCDSAPKGEDLVCAAASILILQLKQAFEENEQRFEYLKCDIKEGDTTIKWKAKKEHEQTVKVMLYMTMTGYRVLQHNNDEYLAIN